jgi:hypothetical protein
MTFDTAAIYGRLIRSSGDPTEVLARYDTAQNRVTASVEVAPIVDMRRGGRWLWVLQMTSTANARSPGFYPLGNAAELSWLDPVSLIRQGSLPLHATGVMAIVHDTLWVGTTAGILRVSLTDGHLVDTTPINVGEGTNVASIADTVVGDRVYVATERLQQFSVVALDDATGAIVARGQVVGSGPGGARIAAGDSGVWFSYATGSLGASVRIDSVTLGGTVALNDNTRPMALSGRGLLWVDGSWGGFVGCADAGTGQVLWRQNFANNVPVMFAIGIDGRWNAYAEWTAVEPPALCRTQ